MAFVIRFVFVHILGVQVGFQTQEYQTSEEQGSVIACIEVLDGNLATSIEVTLMTVEGSATGL